MPIGIMPSTARSSDAIHNQWAWTIHHNIGRVDGELQQVTLILPVMSERQIGARYVDDGVVYWDV